MFVFPCTEGRFGKDGLVNNLGPTPHHVGFFKRKNERGEQAKPKDLDHNLMDYNLSYYFNLIRVLMLERAASYDFHLREGDVGTERKLKSLSSCQLYLSTRYSHLQPLPPSSCQSTKINRMLCIRWDFSLSTSHSVQQWRLYILYISSQVSYGTCWKHELNIISAAAQGGHDLSMSLWLMLIS